MKYLMNNETFIIMKHSSSYVLFQIPHLAFFFFKELSYCVVVITSFIMHSERYKLILLQKFAVKFLKEEAVQRKLSSGIILFLCFSKQFINIFQIIM